MALRFQPARGASVVISSSSRGPAGAAATIAVGTASALAAGATPTVGNSGSSSAATFDFGIPRGADAGIKWLYDSSTSMADPGSGDIRFNNATLSSVTAIAVSATGSGVDVSDYVATWDDSTNTTKGHIVIREEAAGVAAVFAVTSVTDNTTWLQLAVTYVSGSLALTAADPLYVVPMLIGNKGADGSGTFPGSSTDNAVVRFDGTAGTTVQNSSVTINDTGDITANSILLGNTGLDVYDTNGTHSLKLKPGSDLTANRILTLTTGDAARTVTISGDSTISQDYSTTGNPQFATVELGAASDTTLARVSAGVASVEGKTIAMLSQAQTFSAVQTYTAAKIETPVVLSDGATPALDAALGNIFTLAAAGNRTIAVPSNAVSGQKIVIRHLASGGARTLALNSGAGGFRFGTDITALTETASGKYDYIGCIYNAVDSKWDVVAYSKGY